MEMNFCRQCGKPLTHIEKNAYKCATGHRIYANSALAMGVFFLTPDNQVILSERGIEPHKGMLDVFGGFLDGEESFEAATVRELREELSLEPEEYEPVRYLASATDRYPFGNESVPYVAAFFWTRLITNRPLSPSDDVAAIRTFPLHQVNLAALHDDGVRQGILALQRLFPVDTDAQKS